MRKPASMKALEKLGRIRLSEHFFMREMLYSEIANFPRHPERAGRSRPRHRRGTGNPALRRAARAVARHLRARLDPLRLPLRRGQHLRPRAIKQGLQLRRNDLELRAPRLGPGAMPTAAWEPPPASSSPGSSRATEAGTPWQAMAWWVHDHLPYSDMAFFPTYAAFNLRWCERPAQRIESFARAQGMPHQARHGEPRRRPFPGVPRLPGTQAPLTRPPTVARDQSSGLSVSRPSERRP